MRLNSGAGSESALLWVGGGVGRDCSEEVDLWDWGVEHIFWTLDFKSSKTYKVKKLNQCTINW